MNEFKFVCVKLTYLDNISGSGLFLFSAVSALGGGASSTLPRGAQI